MAVHLEYAKTDTDNLMLPSIGQPMRALQKENMVIRAFSFAVNLYTKKE